MYYQVTGDSRNSYARLVFLNEMVSGQEIEYIDKLISKENEQPLNFDQEDCYICLLGLKKAVYSGFYGLTANQYMKIYVQFEQKIYEYLKNHGYIGEIYLHLYGDKQIIIIFSRTKTSSLLPLQVAQYAQNCLQLIYCEQFLTDSIYCNQTYFNNEPTNRRQLSTVLRKLIQLSSLNFFYMEPVVVSSVVINKLKKVTNESDIRELKQKITSAVRDGNFSTCKAAMEELLLQRIKYSLDFYLLQDAVHFLKSFYLECCIAYGISMEDNVDRIFDPKCYEKIETYTKGMLFLFEKVICNMNLKGRKYSQLIQKSLRIINTSFHKADVNASYIASQINVSPSYLSSVFNREVDASISQYLTDLRITKAKKLLEETNLLITDISLSVGYDNKRYFTQVFKQNVGCTPKEYRDNLIK